MKRYYTIEKTLSCFEVFSANEQEVKQRIGFEEESNYVGNTTHGNFKCLYYSNGMFSDIIIGQWTFSGIIKGNFKIPDNYTLNHCISYKINAVTPEKERIEILWESGFCAMDLLLKTYYSLIYEISGTCVSKEDAERMVKFKKMSSTETQWDKIEDNFSTLCYIRKLIAKLADTDDTKAMLSLDWKDKLELFKQTLNKMIL